MLELIATIAGLLGLSFKSLVSAVSKARKMYKEKQKMVSIDVRNAKLTKLVMDGLITRAIKGYYTAESLKRGGLTQYASDVNGVRVNTSLASNIDWTGLSIPLGGGQEICKHSPSILPAIQIPIEIVARYIAHIEQMGLRLWDAHIYRLVDLDINTNHLQASFAIDQFFNYRFTIGLLLDELVETLVDNDLDVDKVVSGKERFLPLRGRLLPGGSSLANFSNRMCAGGVEVLSAFARSEPENDFVIPIERRSKLVADAHSMLSIVPKAFHQPLVDDHTELKLSFTVYRELCEELFGVEELNKDSPWLKADWFLNSCKPIKWLMDHRDEYNLECTYFGINLISGNYTFGILLVVSDDSFWKQYGSLLRTNWEAVHTSAVSTSDPEELSTWMRRPDWVGESLVSFTEGLKRLKKLNESRVHLPTIEYLIA